MPITSSLAPAGAADLLSVRARRTTSSVVRDLLEVAGRPEVISLAGGLPDDDALPVQLLRDLLGGLFDAHGPALLQYSATEGDPGLRAVIAEQESREQARAVGPDDVLICTGSQQALDLLGRVLLDPGDVVAVEDPCYLGALQALGGYDCRFVGVAQDEDGMRVDLLADRLAAGLRPKLVYLTPTYSNPAGRTTPAPRRRELAALADRYGFLVVEDDPYRALHFDAPAPDPIARYTDRVVRLGSYSKVLSPGLRVGWVVAPPEVRAALVRSKQSVDLHTSTLTQQLAREAVRTTEFGALLRETRYRYAARATALHGALGAELGHRLRVPEPTGGMFSWVTFTDGTDTAALLPAALARGVAFVPGSAFAVDTPADASARLCFATNDPARLQEAVRRLSAALVTQDRTRGRVG